ncbi:MAG: putative 7-carboxy-7-deazaguanine synthase QueE [Lachnospiraceae bacterium]|nr:putative 7-carboxy-7-deazaguanine synthase QueE [Lachnospiraceae bacterium]MBQ9934290.1 putative 7-carboxy-7-deazaguanine synthase QueE [Lachnospiraceae bacterium]
MGKFKVVEKFISINGEGRCAGELAAFIRFAGCNLNCSYCDTKWANEPSAPYEILSEEEIYAYIKEQGVNNVTLTGGEPLLQENIGRLIKLLSKDKDLRIELETNGAVAMDDFINIGENVTFTLDYKLPGSKMNHMMVMENYDLIRDNDTVKFVVSGREDLDKAREIIEEYNLTDRVAVYLSSSFGVIKPEDIVNYMMEHNMNKVKLQLQMHKYIWDPNRKGV